ncbi:sigma-70 family RNA polymerase sigma factor [Chondrinema litorale]|uniref:sigma-70 family RNA polymerase sigma factor n=1 Tax=Chondrinema litorale TaxID=2994555 RepID=UPI002542893A|nr:sigma-70 family RNA polymerase sigma factor [Chondrinema litorale]UZR94022.1 sigma-70 family RNA polymerase sigma factor [Chondrinema litorale]
MNYLIIIRLLSLFRALSICLENIKINKNDHQLYIIKAVVDSVGKYWLSSSNTYHKTSEEIKEELILVRRSQKNTDHFAVIYERYFDSIFIYINRRIGDEDVTADLCSNVFYKCLNNLPRYRFQGLPFSSWLFKIALNEVNLYFRTEKNKERLVSLSQNHLELLVDEIEIGIAEKEKQRRLLINLLENLNADEVVFLELRFFEGRSFKEIAYLLGLTEVNAKIKTYRIIEKMKKKLYSMDSN